MQTNIKMIIPGGLDKQSGFTLIELVMVIVILGILSAFAIPRFADLSGQAEIAAVEGARASVKSASAIVHAMSLAESTAAAASGETVTMEGSAITIVYGYPALDGVAANLDLGEAASLGDFTLTYDAADATAATVTVIEGLSCFTYAEAGGANTPPVISDIQVYTPAVVGPPAVAASCP